MCRFSTLKGIVANPKFTFHPECGSRPLQGLQARKTSQNLLACQGQMPYSDF